MKAGHITIRRLKKLIQIMESIPDPDERMPDGRPKFCMRYVRHTCGAPQCQAGWWIAKSGRFVNELGYRPFKWLNGKVAYSYTHAMRHEFPGLKDQDFFSLFSAGSEILAWLGKHEDVCGNGPTRDEVVRFDKELLARLLSEG